MGGILIAGIVFVAVWFQPQKLLIEQTVDEDLPTSTGVTSPETDSEEDSKPNEVLREGTFQALEHPTLGTAKVVRVSDGRLFLRLEGLDTSNGPDLRLYLSEIPASDDWHAYGERFVDLGALKGNRGNHNYEIPPGTDLTRYRSAVIWCRRFTVGFGVAGFS